MSSIFTSLDNHMSSVYGVNPLSTPNTYPVQRYIPYLTINRGEHNLSTHLHRTYINTFVLYTITQYTQLMYSINRQVPCHIRLISFRLPNHNALSTTISTNLHRQPKAVNSKTENKCTNGYSINISFPHFSQLIIPINQTM